MEIGDVDTSRSIFSFNNYALSPLNLSIPSAYLMGGKIKYRAHKLNGLESAIEGINLLFTGGNTGKLMVEL